MEKLWLDIETYSAVDLKKANVYRYSEDASFKILMCAWSTDGETVNLAIGEEEIKNIPGLFDDNILKVAHNASFERVCFSRLAGFGVDEFLNPETYDDTMARAAEWGYPKSLKALAKALEVEEKDEAGTALINYFCKPITNGKRKGERRTPEDSPEKWDAFCAYCIQDVVTLIAVDKALPDWPTESERKAWVVDQTINDRGVKIDVDMAAKAVSVDTQLRDGMVAEIRRITGVENPNSVKQLLVWLQDHGYPADSLAKDNVEAVLNMTGLTVPDDTRRVLEIRQELALSAAKKYTAALNIVNSDGRLRGNLKFFGAHTGRFAGSGLQLQNLPRAGYHTEAEYDAAIFDLMQLDTATPYDLKALIRPLLVGPFTIVDYSAIEARVIAWLAGEEWVLEAFRQGRDIYVETANRLGEGFTRQQGKAAVLGLGYGGGVNALRVMGATGEDYELQKLVDLWRKTNPKIRKFWYDLQDAMMHGGDAGPYIQITVPDPRTRILWLPSGRGIVYRGVRIVEEGGRPAIKFRSTQYNGTLIKTWGGTLAENCFSGNTIVLTDSGFKRLIDVKIRDLVWDGVEFVNHEGIRYSGDRETIELDGIRVTPDHQILTAEGWANAETITRSNRAEVRLPDGSQGCRIDWEEVPDLPRGGRGRLVHSTRRAEPVYDILNCGPRHRFVVFGVESPYIAHNCTQATARDILVHALNAMYDRGFKVVAHVHDEILVEGNATVEEIRDIMCTNPPWAKDLPLNGEGIVTKRYRKG